MNNRTLEPGQARSMIRSGHRFSTTSGISLGYAQANIVILPEDYAADFHRFCTLNRKACPLLYVSAAGQTEAPALGADIDIRTDIAGYRVYRNGKLTEQQHTIQELWRKDFVTFYIGCSFSFEEALISHGIPLRHVENGSNVSMFNTNVPLHDAGPFKGNMVVSYRPMRPADAIRAIQITSDMSQVHGAPVHIGNPSQIGIDDIRTPDYGDPVDILESEIEVFWACGVSPQAALTQARLPLAITHSPGQMLILDTPNWVLRNA
jgi:uncharacterized protein YcsI (UPF0317 family)